MTLHHITITSAHIWYVLIIGLLIGAAIASTYWYYYLQSLKEENIEMRESLGRPVKDFSKK